jgi:hypothetical protein
MALTEVAMPAKGGWRATQGNLQHKTPTMVHTTCGSREIILRRRRSALRLANQGFRREAAGGSAWDPKGWRGFTKKKLHVCQHMEMPTG